MGLGKTLQALCIAEFFRQTDGPPVLILCPTVLRSAWSIAVSRWLPRVIPAAVHAPSTAAHLRRLLAGAARPPRDPWDVPIVLQYVVVSYDLLPRLPPPDLAKLHRGTFRIVIADEAHTFRNLQSARAVATLPVLLAASRRILISGTPALSTPAELYPILHAILSTPMQPFMPRPDFDARYAPNRHISSRAFAYEDELAFLLGSVMIRRAKGEVERALPRKVRRHAVLEIAGENLSVLASMVEEMRDCAEKMADPIIVHDMRVELSVRRKSLAAKLFHKTADLKIPGVVTRVKQLLNAVDGPRKFLVFAHHLHVLDAVEALANREQASYVRIDGRTPAANRNGEVAAFQEVSGVRMAILSLAVAGTGLTLTAADLVLFAELSWVPSVLAQAEDRAHRLGRVGEVVVEYLVAPGTVDDLMWTAVRSKLNVINKTVDGSVQKRREAFDVSRCEGKRVRVSRVDVQKVVTDTINAIEEEKLPNA